MGREQYAIRFQWSTACSRWTGTGARGRADVRSVVGCWLDLGLYKS